MMRLTSPSSARISTPAFAPELGLKPPSGFLRCAASATTSLAIAPGSSPRPPPSAPRTVLSVAAVSLTASIGPPGSAREIAIPATNGARLSRAHSSSVKSTLVVIEHLLFVTGVRLAHPSTDRSASSAQLRSWRLERTAFAMRLDGHALHRRGAIGGMRAEPSCIPVPERRGGQPVEQDGHPDRHVAHGEDGRHVGEVRVLD